MLVFLHYSFDLSEAAIELYIDWTLWTALLFVLLNETSLEVAATSIHTLYFNVIAHPMYLSMVRRATVLQFKINHYLGLRGLFYE